MRLSGTRPAMFAAVALMLALPPPLALGAVSEADKRAAEVAKLRAETDKLKGDNSLLARLPGYGAVLAAGVALGGLFLTLRQQRSDRRKDKEAADTQRDRDRDERDDAATRRFDAQFTQIVANLTSTTPAVRASAAASIRTFLKPEHKRFHEQVVTLLSANLKFPRGDVTDRIVGDAYARALRDHADELPNLFGPDGPDLLEATLQRADLSGLDLSGCDLFRAKLHGTDFARTRLVKARAREADFSSAGLVGADLEAAHMERANLTHARLGGARLVSTKLQDAHAEHAAFDGASLQEANFDGADLRASTFRGADVNNAFFRGTRFDEPALSSIVEADNWRKANLDPDVRSRLEELDAARSKSGDVPPKGHPPTPPA
jgi:uncharacterized protein YjbI with pentapeptide repeats